MKIYQGYITEPMRPFQFLEQYKLQEYTDRFAPVVMFGCYKSRSAYSEFLVKHRARIVIFWMGVDSYEIKDINLRRLITKKQVINVTTLPRIRTYLKKHEVNCHLIQIVARHDPRPLERGNKIYTYLNYRKPEYHGKELIDRLHMNGSMLVGDGTIMDWNLEKADELYGQSYLGLFLSDYVGGGISIQEMGLRGIPVVTNVFNLPHCIPWNNLSDIQRAIREQREGIGKTGTELAKKVYDNMVQKVTCFDLDQLLIK